MTIRYRIGPSPIHGQGVIATDLLNPGEIIGTAIVLRKKGPAITPYLGKYVNHSINANSCLLEKGSKYILVATTIIYPNSEIVSNYHHTPAFIQKPGPQFI